MGKGESVEMSDEYWMRQALQHAGEAKSGHEVPVGAVLVYEGAVIGSGFNQVITKSDPTAHAEIEAIRAAGLVQSNYRHPGTTLYVTLEPCMMCLGALVHARIARIVFGAYDPKTGVVSSVDQLLSRDYLNHRCEVSGGILADECGAMLKQFFQERRD